MRVVTETGQCDRVGDERAQSASKTIGSRRQGRHPRPARGAGEVAPSELGDAVRFIPADVRNEEEVNAAIAAASELGELWVVVCAGTGDAIKTVGKGRSPSIR